MDFRLKQPNLVLYFEKSRHSSHGSDFICSLMANVEARAKEG